MVKKNITNIDNTYGVEGSTFRAFRGFKHSPAEIYRKWAKKQTDQIILSQPTNETNSEDDFKQWHFNLFKSLKKYWKAEQHESISFAHCYKLIDLFIKWLSQYIFNDAEFVKNLNKFASCALDSQTLKRLNLCYNNFLPLNNPRMGDIDNQNTYDYCQKLVSEFCAKANATKLEFDYWAWKKGG